jgi:hypothetical protein
MAARSSTYQDQAINAAVGGFFRMADIRYIRIHQTAIGMDDFNDSGRRTERCNDNRRFVLADQFDVLLVSFVRPLMADEVDGPWHISEGFFDFPEPRSTSFCRTGIQKRKRSDDSCPPGFNDQLRS